MRRNPSPLPPIILYWLFLTDEQRVRATLALLRYCESSGLVEIPGKLLDPRVATQTARLRSYSSTIAAQAKKSGISADEVHGYRLVRELLGYPQKFKSKYGPEDRAYESTAKYDESTMRWAFQLSNLAMLCGGYISTPAAAPGHLLEKYEDKKPRGMVLEFIARSTPLVAPLVIPLAMEQWATGADAVKMLEIAHYSLPPQLFAALVLRLLSVAVPALSPDATKLRVGLDAFAQGRIDLAAFDDQFFVPSLAAWQRARDREELIEGSPTVWGLGALLTGRMVRRFPQSPPYSPSASAMFNPRDLGETIVRLFADFWNTKEGIVKAHLPGSRTSTATAALIRTMLPQLP